jgi:hypothetical protein
VTSPLAGVSPPDVLIMLRHRGGAWEWDIRWPGPPAMRSTGSYPGLGDVMDSVTADVLAQTLQADRYREP